MLKVLLNLFSAARNTWPAEWDDPSNYVLTKTLGFSGVMRALPELVNNGQKTGDLSADYFTSVFARVRQRMQSEHIELTTVYFAPGASGEAYFAEMIRHGITQL